MYKLLVWYDDQISYEIWYYDHPTDEQIEDVRTWHLMHKKHVNWSLTISMVNREYV